MVVMEEHEPTTRDLALAAADAARRITVSTKDDDDVLTYTFLRVSWPSVRAQNQ